MVLWYDKSYNINVTLVFEVIVYIILWVKVSKFYTVTKMSSETAQVSSLPLPPMQYINFYTDDNVRRNRAPLPPRPIHDSYSMFGHPFNADDAIIRSLESQVRIFNTILQQ